MKRDILIGDVHGCFDELMQLLEELEVTPEDRVISVGDLVDRGPDSVRLWEFFRDRPNSVVLMGNHERKHVRGIFSYSQEIVRLQFGEQYEAFRTWAADLPYYLETPEYVAVHGGFEAGVPLAEQREDVLAATTSGSKHLAALYDGGDWTDRYTGNKPIVFGHRIVGDEPVWFGDRAVGLDTGACHGGALTALVVPGFTLHSVRATRDHWKEARSRWQVPVLRSRPWATYKWTKITRERASLDRFDAEDVVEFRDALDAWVAELHALVPTLVQAAGARAAALRSETPDDATFKRRAASERFPALVFGSDAGTLDAAAVRAHLPTPGAICDAATWLGVGSGLDDGRLCPSRAP